MVTVAALLAGIAAGMAADGLRDALDSYTQAQDELVDLTGYPR
jgi:hypothetical protein